MREKSIATFTVLFVWIASVALAQPRSPVATQSSSGPALAPLPVSDGASAPGLQRFGANLFQSTESGETFAGGALPPDYQLGPGDQLAIFLGGKAQESFQLAVSVDGQLYMPTVGVLYVNGLTLEEFRQRLDAKLGTLYSNYSLNIMLTVPKMVSVSVIGEVSRPGNYTDSALSSVLDFIMKAQGLTEKGSFRNIQVFRGDSLVAYIDLYDFILRPTGRQNFSLQSGDIIFVPVTNKSVTVLGEVNRNAIFELNTNRPDRLCDIIELAGGFTRFSHLNEVEVSRVTDAGGRETFCIDFTADPCRDDARNLLLEPDDFVFVRKIPNREVGALVEVRGEVLFPGFFPIIIDTTRLSDVIRAAGGFTDDALIGESKLERRREVVLDDKEFERLSQMSRADMSESEYEYLVMKHNSDNINEIVVDFSKLMQAGDHNEDVLLKDGDVIHVPKRPDMVYVSGRVSKPGGILFVPGQDFAHYIDKAGGYTWDADKKRAKIIKVTGEITDRDEIKTFEPGDRIFVPREKDHNWWKIFYDSVIVLGQLAAVYLVIRTATD
ncbi:SLBB domain-containing protein [candidate division KSB1 bacterium]|nr:SLBB domain-containing protein [candidate division KSB1 bacterium]